MEASGEREPLIIECADGTFRAVSFHIGTKLVRRSVPIELKDPNNPEDGWRTVRPSGEAVEKMGLNERQRQGLGMPPGYEGPVDVPVKGSDETWNPWDDPL